MTQSNHCLYYAISKYLKLSVNIDLQPADIFQLFGGIAFKIVKSNNEHTSLFNIYGSNKNFEYFKQLTGITINVTEELNQEEALFKTFEMIKNNQIHMVYTNCFYLPYDKNNFNQTHNNHVVIIHDYDPVRKEFTISDSLVDFAKIDIETLMIARQNTEQGTLRFVDIDVSKAYDPIEIINNVDNSCVVNVKSYYEHLQAKFDEFIEMLNTLNNLEGIAKNFGFHTLARSILGVNGMVYTRHLMANSFKSKNINLFNEYIELSNNWNLFTANLLKLQKNKCDIDDITSLFKGVYYGENKLCETLLSTESKV
ncbi:BtrH N-terminal domain-containing protein [Robertmurraya kyonggiensis]|uniref:Butirosin biosynthesis protein H N-terminal domain-containing protein n=1 Tax=Robertmurraya kyonggiensis TaxID=1037680 RepID=A0A4U1DAR0_9BACI|nr:BtrH N-terminal domain-containing protein [Robertmurraya kyonggiensis]TKC19123.1 hypothetical protein FA727_06140 [Robertmurraya kyonggiensis]